MNCKVLDEDAQIIIDGMDALIRTYENYGYKWLDLERIVNIGIYFQAMKKKIIDSANNPTEEEDGPPKKDEQFVYGKGNVKKSTQVR